MAFTVEERLKAMAQKNAVIFNTLNAGGDAVSCLVALHEVGLAKDKMIIELLSIAPRKMKGPDGREYVWHCPDELVPLTET